jgi:hypothetical protein
VQLQESGYETAFDWISFRGRQVDLATEIAADGKSSKVEGYMTEILKEPTPREAASVGARRSRMVPTRANHSPREPSPAAGGLLAAGARN